MEEAYFVNFAKFDYSTKKSTKLIYHCNFKSNGIYSGPFFVNFLSYSNKKKFYQTHLSPNHALNRLKLRMGSSDQEIIKQSILNGKFFSDILLDASTKLTSPIGKFLTTSYLRHLHKKIVVEQWGNGI